MEGELDMLDEEFEKAEDFPSLIWSWMVSSFNVLVETIAMTHA